VNTAVVELEALADAVGTAADDHDVRPGFDAEFVIDRLAGAAAGVDLREAALVRGVVVWRAGFELGGAGVDQLETGAFGKC
jgi:hypothetical protein